MDCILLGFLLVIGAFVVFLIGTSLERFKVPKRPCMAHPQCKLHSYSILDNGWRCKDSEGPCQLDRFCVSMYGCKGGPNLGCFDNQGACVSGV